MKSISSWFLVAILLFSICSFAQSSDVAALYKSKCGVCHGADGTGDTPMGKKLGVKSYKSPDVQKESDAALQIAIVNGKGKMPSYKSLPPEQVDALVKLVRDLGK